MAYPEGLHTISLEELRLDPENPRLPEEMHGQGEEAMINWMLLNASLTDLMASIAENDFFAGEPLVGINGPDGSVVVVEGNRRLAAAKLLVEPQMAGYLVKTVGEIRRTAEEKDYIPGALPVFLVADRAAVANYLGFRHISGVKPWPVIAKARYVYSLYEPLRGRPDAYRVLAREIGSKPVYMRRLVIGYQLYLHIQQHGFYDVDRLSEETFDLSLINDAATKHNAIEGVHGRGRG